MFALELNGFVSTFGSEVTIEEDVVHNAVTNRVIERLRPVNIVEPMDLETEVYNQTVNSIKENAVPASLGGLTHVIIKNT